MSFLPQLSPSSLDHAVTRIAEAVREAGGHAYLVGGAVRDLLRGQSATDADMEVFGLEPEALENLLRAHYRIEAVGVSFGIFKVKGLDLDVGLPRREQKTGSGHKAFAIEGDPFLTLPEAAARRDFTFNAIYLDPLTRVVTDPFGGANDLRAGVLRHTTERFAEDPLRVLRGMQFCARFALTPTPETIALCRTMEMEGLASERIFEEWRKLLLKGTKISQGLHFLEATGWLRFFPELKALVGCPQDPEWHPEGDVWTHTGHCLDAFAAARIGDDWEDLVVGLAVLCHDIGKPPTTALVDGRWRSPAHEPAGEPLTRSFLARMTRQSDLVEAVVPLVTNHLRPMELFKTQPGDGAIRRLARKVGRIDRLVRVADADMRGRPPKQVDHFEAGAWLLARARALAVADAAPKPLVLGRHLVDEGLEPGPHFGEILEHCYEAQLEGTFSDLDGGLAFLKTILAQRSK